MNKNNLYWKLGLVVLITGLAVWSFTPPSEKVSLGLDLKGGVHLVPGRDGRLRAMLQAGERARYSGTTQRCGKVQPLIEARRQIAGECVASTHRINRHNLEALRARKCPFTDSRDTIGPKRHHEALPGLAVESGGAKLDHGSGGIVPLRAA